MYIRRQIEQQLSYLSEHFPAVVITGARQTGKTTLVKHLMDANPEMTYVTLDYPRIRDLARTDPELFLQQYPAPIIIDEIQYAPELLPYVKIRIDENRVPGQFFLTGSQMFRLMKNVTESLAGRTGILSLYGLSRSEILGTEEIPFLPSNKMTLKSTETISTVFDKIYRGSMPQMIIDPDLTPESYFGEYLQTYLERDIRDLLEIKNESKFLKFLSCVAVRTGQELNLNDLGKDIGIDTKTAESWLSLLVSSGLVYLLQPYSNNTIKRIVKRPKLYFMDTGLACYLSLWNNPRVLEISAMAGAMFETYVVSEMIKEYANQGIDVRSRLTYYRDNNGREIDLMIMENGILYPIEIKKSADPGKDALKNFNVLKALPNEIGAGAVICLSPVMIPLDKQNKIIPIGMI
ncbi:MAG: ATP-binding protein [Lachnospiraceae bacterium]|nr:ATP-binding protein [Lachnospiraceae bacterium]